MMVLDIVGWEVPVRSVRSSSVRLWRWWSGVVLSPWVRVSAGGLLPGLSRVRWWVRAVMSVVNCWVVGPVVRWFCNGSSGLA